jgi:WD40 repeat protein
VLLVAVLVASNIEASDDDDTHTKAKEASLGGSQRLSSNVVAFKLIGLLKGHDGSVGSVSWSSDGRYLSTTSEVGKVPS